VEDASGRLKLHKCKGPVRLGGGGALSNLVPKYSGQSSEACTCDSGDYKLSLAGRRKKFFKKSKCHSLGRTEQGGEEPGETLSNVPAIPGSCLQGQVSF
jgi:extracellular sulfatase Sulf